MAEAVKRAEEHFGAIDVLVDNAGYGYRAAVGEGRGADVRQLFATHSFGAVDMIKAALPGMRARRSGVIAGVSSVATRVNAPGSGYCSATKAALEAVSASPRNKVTPLGITAMAKEPGAFRTDFARRSLQQSPDVIADGTETAGKRRKENDTADGTQPGAPVTRW
ncbi:SDR family NAD(P)-dependent oxidoreductase [Streptomyces sp. P9-A2]